MNNSNNDCGCGSKGTGWIPLNSKIQVNERGGLNIQPPPGWIYVGTQKDTNQVLKVATGSTSVSCTCNGTGKCNPFTASGSGGTTSGCAGNCTDCSMKQSARISVNNSECDDIELQKGDFIEVDFENGGYIDLSDRIEFIDSQTQIPAAFTAMFQLPEVNEALKMFIDRVYGGLPFPKVKIGKNFIAVPEGHSMAFVKIFGRAVVIPVPTISLRTVVAGETASKASCSCTEGSCTIKTQSIPLLGSASWCEGSCSGTCTLTTGAIVANGNVKVLHSAISYRF